MRHRDSGRKLNRTSAHRRAMLRNMTNSLLVHELLRTTVPKAKELRRFAEPLITLAASDSVANRRRVFAKLRDHDSVGKLFSDLGPRYRERPGGYLRILKDGYRVGDKAPMSVVELVGRPERVDDLYRAREARLTAEDAPVTAKPELKGKSDTEKASATGRGVAEGKDKRVAPEGAKDEKSTKSVAWMRKKVKGVKKSLKSKPKSS